MKNSLKIRTFKETIEPILLYGSECWTIDPTIRKQIDGCYTRLLRMATNISWKDKVTNIQQYSGMLKISEVIKKKIATSRSMHKAPRRTSAQLNCMETKGRHKKQREIAKNIHTHLK